MMRVAYCEQCNNKLNEILGLLGDSFAKIAENCDFIESVISTMRSSHDTCEDEISIIQDFIKE